MKKRIISMLLAVCMVIACTLAITPSVSAEATSVQLTVGSAHAAIGDTVILPVTVNVDGIDGDFEWNALYAKVNKVPGTRLVAVYNVAANYAEFDVGEEEDCYNIGAQIAKPWTTVNGEEIIELEYKVISSVSKSSTFSFELNSFNYNNGTSAGSYVNITEVIPGTITVSGSAPAATEYGQDHYDEEAGDLTYECDPAGYFITDELGSGFYYWGEETVITAPKEIENIDSMGINIAAIEKLILLDNIKTINNFPQQEFTGTGVTSRPMLCEIKAFGNPEVNADYFGYYDYRKATGGTGKFTKTVISNLVVSGWAGGNLEQYCKADANLSEAFVPLDEFKPMGYQLPTTESGIKGFRIDSEIRYADIKIGDDDIYKSASVDLTPIVYSSDGSVKTSMQTKNVPIPAVYTSISSKYGPAVEKSEGYYFSAVAVKGLDAAKLGEGEYIVFEVVNNVTNCFNAITSSAPVYFKYSADGSVVQLTDEEIPEQFVSEE